jgi:hypothetical protein
MQVRTTRRRLGQGVVAFAALAAAAAAFLGAATPARAAGCSYGPMSPVFLPWADVNNYFLAPGANFENGLGGWSASGGAQVVSGNEPYNVGGAGANSLSLPTASASATTPAFCVSLDSPTFRVFVRNTGSAGIFEGALGVYLNVQSPNGTWQQVKIAGVKMLDTSWNLTLPIAFVQYVPLSVVLNGYANVSLTFKPNDNHGNWQIDDMYVDPYRSK